MFFFSLSLSVCSYYTLPLSISLLTHTYSLSECLLFSFRFQILLLRNDSFSLSLFSYLSLSLSLSRSRALCVTLVCCVSSCANNLTPLSSLLSRVSHSRKKAMNSNGWRSPFFPCTPILQFRQFAALSCPLAPLCPPPPFLLAYPLEPFTHFVLRPRFSSRIPWNRSLTPVSRFLSPSLSLSLSLPPPPFISKVLQHRGLYLRRCLEQPLHLLSEQEQLQADGPACMP